MENAALKQGWYLMNNGDKNLIKYDDKLCVYSPRF